MFHAPWKSYTDPLATAKMSSNSSPKDADVGAMGDQLASLEVTVGQANAKSFDTSADGGAAGPSEEGERALDSELWKPHPPTEDCPVCFVPLPLADKESTYCLCCGKTICTACTVETVRALHVINTKRAEEKLPPLDHACSFCRSTRTSTTESQFEQRIRKGDDEAAYNLALKYRDGDAFNNIPKDEAKSLELFHYAAHDLGNSTAMGELGSMYLHGISGTPQDKAKGRKYLEDAVKMGDVCARCTLACVEAESGNIKLAIRHWKLAAAAGDSVSTENLWKCFYKGALEKDELEETLRAYKEGCDSMSSTERERWKFYEKAKKEGNDIVLINLLISYYDGEIKAKELNIALKAHHGYM